MLGKCVRKIGMPKYMYASCDKSGDTVKVYLQSAANIAVTFPGALKEVYML